MRYRKKPVMVEALQWTGENWSEVQAFCPSAMYYAGVLLTIQTLEGVMTASVGDWIIRGIEGEFYPCKPAIFEQTYEEVDK